MHPRKTEIHHSYHMHDDFSHQRGTVREIEFVQSPRETIVIEGFRRVGLHKRIIKVSTNGMLSLP